MSLFQEKLQELMDLNKGKFGSFYKFLCGSEIDKELCQKSYEVNDSFKVITVCPLLILLFLISKKEKSIMLASHNMMKNGCVLEWIFK